MRLKSVGIAFHSIDTIFRDQDEENSLLLSRLSMLGHVEEIEVSLIKTEIQLLKVLMKQCGEKITINYMYLLKNMIVQQSILCYRHYIYQMENLFIWKHCIFISHGQKNVKN